MTRLYPNILFFVYLLFSATIGVASESASHLVTVTVAPVSMVGITGGDISLTIDQYTGDGIITSLPNTNSGLIWETNEVDRKITVATNLADPAYSLSIEISDISGSSTATPSGSVIVDTESQDLVSDIDTGTGACTLVYIAETDVASSGQPETHTITYTITSN